MRLTQAAAVTRVKTQGAPERQLRGLHGIRRGSEVRVFDVVIVAIREHSYRRFYRALSGPSVEYWSVVYTRFA
ncbi:hypothetical protein F2P81_014213 [Scophthalmus maximus]|uniref:Uncharacterized protein n=1 Tax=Scophthalmus maximus TaxID=52904 RepID=A0A6A4SLN9_SCOMX|nr:hypothetical protein F2P81_014213 [Scophthalmus maximus]